MVYRKFGYLQAQVLLYKQKELMELEIDLDRLDAEGQRLNPRYIFSLASTTPERKEKIYEIEQKFKEYCKQREQTSTDFRTQLSYAQLKYTAQLLATARELACFNQPPRYNYLNIKSFFDTSRIAFEEIYLYYKEDLVSLKPGREHSWLVTFVETTLHKLADHDWKVVHVGRP